MIFSDSIRTRSHALRPHSRILLRVALSALALVVPVSAVLYWLTIPTGTWQPIAVAQVVIVVLFLIATASFYRTVIWVDADGISERGLFGGVGNFSRSEIGSIILLDLYQNGALDTHPQLFVTGTDGRLLIRMRGQLYSEGAMESVVDLLDVPVVRVPTPMTLQDLNRVRPELLYWFERRISRYGS